MPEDETSEADAPRAKSKSGLLVGLLLAVFAGTGAFYAVYTGLVFSGAEKQASVEKTVEDTELATFVELKPLLITLGNGADLQLRFSAQLEVEPSKKADVENLEPRILDVLNGYLMAVDTTDLQSSTALIKLRVHMLRRIQLVTGDGHVRDLLITEFVLT